LDWCLIGFWLFDPAVWSWLFSPTSWLVILLVAVGLGMVLFVHELGHFAVAKLCGVKCEKFYLGFDIAGWRICRFRWGETEYGIGALPRGGYVTMRGQEDIPARLKEEIERAKATQAAKAGISAQAGGQAASDTPVDVAAAERALYDPRSYLAQSVPKRIAIISAGVIMNMIFAFVAATVAYSIGVVEEPCAVGSVQPGYPAWQCDLRPGDRIVAINGKPARRFKDIISRVPLNRKGTGSPIRVERPGVSEPMDLVVLPNRDLLLPVIGVAAPGTTTLLSSAGWLNSERIKPYVRNTAAARAQPAFELGDRIIKIDGVPVKTGEQLREMLSARRDKPVKVTVQRTRGKSKKDKTVEQLTIKVDPRPMRELGMVMKMGPIMSVQAHSPAALAGIKAHDQIVSMDGKPLGDPLPLPDRLWARVNKAAAAGQSPPTVTLQVKRFERVQRDGKTERQERTLDVPVPLRKTDAFEVALFAGSPVSVPSMGLAYRVLNKVVEVLPDSPAAKAGIVPGDVLTSVTLVPPDEETLAREGLKPMDVRSQTIEFADTKLNWPFVFEVIQDFAMGGSKIELTFQGDKTVSLVPVDAADWYNPDRGLVMQPASFTLTAKSFGEALKLGGEETLLQATIVLRFLQRLTTGDISLKAIGGPITIAQVAGHAASRGPSQYLLFLTTISAMLAVINFLPIPVLDGGHFVFLVYEGIRRKPAPEWLQLALSYAGLILILMLMLWALGLDTKLIPRD